MKRYVKIFMGLFAILLMTGCMKYNIKMEVGKDKSVTLDLISAIDMEKYKAAMSEYSDSEEEMNTEDMFSDIDQDEAKKNGWEVKQYKEDTYEGIEIYKKFNDIDKISSNKKIQVDLSDIANDEKEVILFQKKGNKYIADFIINLNEDDSSSGEGMEEMTKDFDLKYEVKLPNKAIKHNATKVSEDGKTLTWELDYYKKNNIKYEFKLGSGFDPLWIILPLIIIILIVIIVLLVKGCKKAKEAKNVDIKNDNEVKSE